MCRLTSGADADGEAVWPRRWRQVLRRLQRLARDDGGKQALAPRREHGVSRSTPQGGPESPPPHLWSWRSLRDYFARGPTGAGGPPVFPAPSRLKGVG